MVRRKINRIYMVAPVGKKPSQIVSDIEATMDKLKLDISYKAPVIKEVTCGGK